MTMLWFASFLVFSVLINGIGSFECGARKVKINKTIVRGQVTSPGIWPWHVAIYHRREKKGSSEYQCGGTLISEFFVLTADHCIKDESANVLSAKRVFIIVGLHDLDNPNPNTIQQHRISKIHIYGTSKDLKNDIALLELASEVRFNQWVQPACVNQLEDLTNSYGTAIGWGFTEDDELSSILRSHQMPVINTNKCLESDHDTFGFTLDSSLFCAGYLNGTTVCNGDSGGGIHFERQGGVWYVGGIVSFNALRTSADGRLLCRHEGYAGFTNVYHFIPWIRNVTKLQLTQKAGTRANDRPSSLLPQNCGRYLVNRIFHGIDAEKDEFPWMARLVRRNSRSGGRSRTCHGTIISKRYVLTSAWCVHEQRKPYQVQLGEYDLNQDPDCNTYDLSDCAPPVRTVDIESIIRHEEYDDYSPKHDIALIRLKQDVIFDNYIHPVCLPVSEALKQQKLQQYIITGWGRTKKDGRFGDVLQKATVSVVDQSRCRAELIPRFYVGYGVICAGGNGTPNSCSWDNGGPLGYPVRGETRILRFVQYGVTSANGCGEFTSIYTDVTFYMDWILANMT